MVLTYQEAELVAADAIFAAAHDQELPESAYDFARAALSAVGYADLLAEVENLRITVREDKRVMDRDAVEVERLRYVESNLVSAREAGRSYRDQRDALAATVARVEALADEWANSNNFVSRFAASRLHAALEQC